MGWTRKPQHQGRDRNRNRARSRPLVESLEARNLLSAMPAVVLPFGPTPRPAATDSGNAGSTSFDAITGASAARAAYGVDGSGLAVAVIDTGVNYHHQALGGRFGPGAKVEAGFDFAENDGNPDADSWQHGTAVAGLIAGGDQANPGVAPGADIVALRVFGDDNKGSYNRIADALQWVLDNHDRYNISVVNLSIADEKNYTTNWFARDGGVGERITSLIRRLAERNIPVVSAAGNSFQGQQGMGFSAIVGETISVTSTDASDRLVSDAQRLGSPVGGDLATDVAAPGVGLLAPADGNEYTTVEGTSFSTPLVSGAIVLLQQIYQSRFGHLPSVKEVEGWLKAGADPASDPATGIAIGRLDIPKSAALIPAAPAADPPKSPPPAAGPVANPPSAPADPPPAQDPLPPPVDPTPPAPPASEPPPQPTVEVVLNGRSQGQVSPDPEGDAWSSFLASFGFPGTLNRVQVWTSAGALTDLAESVLPQGGLQAGELRSQAGPRNDRLRERGLDEPDGDPTAPFRQVVARPAQAHGPTTGPGLLRLRPGRMAKSGRPRAGGR